MKKSNQKSKGTLKEKNQYSYKKQGDEDNENIKILKENQFIQSEKINLTNQDQDAILVLQQTNEIKDEKFSKKKMNSKRGTSSTSKGKKEVKKANNIDFEFTWKNLTITAYPEIGLFTKYNPEIHKHKVNYFFNKFRFYSTMFQVKLNQEKCWLLLDPQEQEKLLYSITYQEKLRVLVYIKKEKFYLIVNLFLQFFMTLLHHM